ncbi:MAG: hypothetical protein FJ315_09370 [SAR202 cluster bacterium]|nr:hypothetical protein [SAR202 cluster bacterium]
MAEPPTSVQHAWTNPHEHSSDEVLQDVTENVRTLMAEGRTADAVQLLRGLGLLVGGLAYLWRGHPHGRGVKSPV